MGARILLVDADRWAQQVVMSALRDQDHRFDTAGDGREALRKALADPPNLVIAEVQLPGLNGWRLMRRLRAQPQLACTPFVFLTGLSGPEARSYSFRIGADDYLRKPADPGDLAVRVARALHRTRPQFAGRRARGSTTGPGLARGRGLTGGVDGISIAFVLLLLEMERKSGLLILRDAGTGERCRVFVRDGQVVGARMDDVATLRDTELVCHVLRWSGGSFEFKAMAVEMRDRVRATTTELLLEVTRRLDEAERGPPGGLALADSMD